MSETLWKVQTYRHEPKSGMWRLVKVDVWCRRSDNPSPTFANKFVLDALAEGSVANGHDRLSVAFGRETELVDNTNVETIRKITRNAIARMVGDFARDMHLAASWQEESFIGTSK